MSIYEALFNVFCGCCTIYVGIRYVLFVLREYRLEREVRRMWAEANVSGHPLHLGAVSHFADILGIELEKTDVRTTT